MKTLKILIIVTLFLTSEALADNTWLSPFELKIVIKPPYGRIFNQKAPSKFLVRFGSEFSEEGTLRGLESLVPIPKLPKSGVRALDVTISYFHCDKEGVSQCVRVSESRSLPLQGTLAGDSARREIVFG